MPQVAAAKGDYTVKRQQTFNFEYAYGILLGMQQAAITWVSFCFFVRVTGFPPMTVAISSAVGP